jgi:phenylacetaldehyde dehydrogenase
MGMPVPRDLPVQRDLVNGSRRDVEQTGDWLTDPSDGRRLVRAAQSSAETVDIAIEAADALHRSGEWCDPPTEHRLLVLQAFARNLTERAGAIARADAIDSGVPLHVTTMFADGLPGVVLGAVDFARAEVTDRELVSGPGSVHLVHRAWGPVAVIAPFNAPAFTVVKKSAYALAAGCPVIAKPSALAPHGANLVADALAEAIAECGAPPAVFQLLHGDGRIGQQLATARQVRCIAFTGGRAAGRAIARAASEHFPALQLECGSNNPAIVRDDADVGQTAASLATGFTKLNGQWCESPGSVFVAADVHDELLERLLERLGTLRAGDPLDPTVDFGPQAHAGQRQQAEDAVERLERAGGTRHLPRLDLPAGGHFLAPTVVTGVDPAETVHEIFGPVLTLHPVDGDDAALTLANSRAGGLAGYVFGADVAAAARLGARITAGEVRINGTSVLDMHDESAQSFWEGSGIGGHGNDDLLRFFSGVCIIGVEPPGMPL